MHDELLSTIYIDFLSISALKLRNGKELLMGLPNTAFERSNSAGEISCRQVSRCRCLLSFKLPF